MTTDEKIFDMVDQIHRMHRNLCDLKMIDESIFDALTDNLMELETIAIEVYCDNIKLKGKRRDR